MFVILHVQAKSKTEECIDYMMTLSEDIPLIEVKSIIKLII